ncbi:hypothetical protein Tco_1021164, partial [Tanacetum coccineum]
LLIFSRNSGDTKDDLKLPADDALLKHNTKRKNDDAEAYEIDGLRKEKPKVDVNLKSLIFLLCWITQYSELNAAFDPIAEIHLQTRLEENMEEGERRRVVGAV